MCIPPDLPSPNERLRSKLTELQVLYEKIEEAHGLAMSMKLYLLGEKLSAIMDQLYEMSLKELPF